MPTFNAILWTLIVQTILAGLTVFLVTLGRKGIDTYVETQSVTAGFFGVFFMCTGWAVAVIGTTICVLTLLTSSK